MWPSSWLFFRWGRTRRRPGARAEHTATFRSTARQTTPLTGTEVIDDLPVVFTHEKAEVEVTLTGLREPEDPGNVLVMLFSEDPVRWHAGSVQYTAIQATADMSLQRATAGGGGRPAGRVFSFLLGAVVPGRYLVVAVPSPGVMNPTERVILERLRPLAVPVTLAAGVTAKVELPISR